MPLPGKELECDIVRHGGSAVIPPVLDRPEGPAIVFVRTIAISIARTLLEIPAGTLGKGEDPGVCGGVNSSKKPVIALHASSRWPSFSPTRA